MTTTSKNCRKGFMKWSAFLICTFLYILQANAQQANGTSGVVVDAESGEPLVGASITVKGTQTGRISDINGAFTFNHPLSEQQVLTVSYIGYQTVNVPVQRRLMRIALSPSENQLDNVVIQVAYGTAQKKAITGAVSTVDSKQIEMRPVSAVTSVLNGLVPGVQAVDGIGQPGYEAQIRVRGYSSINGSNSPLIVVDGMPYTGGMTDLNPADVESVSVLKDAASCALYGSRASNGVILITTKSARKTGTSLQLGIRQGFSHRGQSDYDRMNPGQFMETMWQSYRNSLVSTQGKTLEEAGVAASNDLIPAVLGLNIFNKADNELFDANGHLVADAQMLDSYAEDLDWYDPYTRNGYRQEYNLSGETGTEKSHLRFSLGYLDDNGFAKKSNFNRIIGQMNADFNPVPWIKTGLSLNASRQVTDWNAGAVSANQTSSTSNGFYFARRIAPIYPVHQHYMNDVYDANGALLHAKGDYILDEQGEKQYDDGSVSRVTGDAGTVERHIMLEMEKDMRRSTSDNIAGKAYADINFLRDFTFSLQGNTSLRNYTYREYGNGEIGAYKSVSGNLVEQTSKHKEYYLKQMLTWRHAFGAHLVEWMAAHENYDYQRDYNYLRKTHESIPGITEMSNFTTMNSITGYKDTYRTEGYLTRALYNYNDTYFLEASFRRDGSSIFYTDNRWGNFWSTGASWIVSNEAFMQDVSWINNLKLRFSYGQVGNDNFGSGSLYKWMQLYSSITEYGGSAAYFKTQNENKDLKWETNSTWNVGVDTRIFNRVNLSFNYFDKRSDDLLFSFVQPLSSGATDSSTAQSTVWKNVGSMSNRGWELSIDGDVVRNRDWQWNVGVNLWKTKNKVGRLPDKEREQGILVDNYYKLQEGESFYDFWLYQYEGVDQMTGQAVYRPDYNVYFIADSEGHPVNADEDVTGRKALAPEEWTEINGEYYVGKPQYAGKGRCGNALPKINGSITTSLRWKDLTLSALMNFSCGSKVLDLPYRTLMGTATVHALSTDLAKAWNGIPEGMTETSPCRIDPDGVPQVNYDTTINGYNSPEASSRYLVSGNYFTLKNVTLAYRLPAMWSSRLGLGAMRVYGSVENAFLLSKRKGLNPAQSFDGVVRNYTSIARVFTLGININL